jgi:hypothetical protein
MLLNVFLPLSILLSYLEYVRSLARPISVLEQGWLISQIARHYSERHTRRQIINRLDVVVR